MKFEQRGGGKETEQDKFISGLKEHSMYVGNLYLQGTGTNMADTRMRPMTWNENQGVIIYADRDGGKWAIPGTSENREKFFQAGSEGLMEQDESVGVPGLNNLDVIGPAESSQARTEWLRLYEDAKRIEAGNKRLDAMDTAKEKNVEQGA